MLVSYTLCLQNNVFIHIYSCIHRFSFTTFLFTFPFSNNLLNGANIHLERNVVTSSSLIWLTNVLAATNYCCGAFHFNYKPAVYTFLRQSLYTLGFAVCSLLLALVIIYIYKKTWNILTIFLLLSYNQIRV